MVLKLKEQNFDYHRTQMQKELILLKLKEQGCRITKQRLMLLDIILEEEYSCCKEIYYRASKLDPGIGTATVYRMVNRLEEIGAISRKNMYKVACDSEEENKHVCTVELDDRTLIKLSEKRWNQIIQAGLVALGYVKDQNMRSVTTSSDRGAKENRKQTR